MRVPRHSFRAITAQVAMIIFILIPPAIYGSIALEQSQNRSKGERLNPSAVKQIQFEQRLNTQIPLGLQFSDEAGVRVRFGTFFRANPVIVVLGYFRCPMLCDVVLNGVVQSLHELKWNAGDQFEVLVISIDSSETAELAALKKKKYVSRYGRANAALGWHFLTGTADAIQALADEIGFRFVYDPASNEFAHPSGLVVLTPQGTISRYFFGIHYPPRDLFDALVEAQAQRVSTPVKPKWLLCFDNDLFNGSYGRVILNSVRTAGAIAVAILVYGIAYMIRKERAHGTKPPRVANK